MIPSPRSRWPQAAHWKTFAWPGGSTLDSFDNTNFVKWLLAGAERMLVANPDKLGALAIWVVSFVLCIAMIALTWAEFIG
jgi:hypothetical protein